MNRPSIWPDRDSPFYVSPIVDLLGRLVERFPNFWRGLGGLESSVLASELASVRIVAPMYVCGLARSGSTLLHEVLASHRDVATHRVKDFPMVYTPYWWRQATARIRPGPSRERPHRDKMMIASESPDSIEEMLWTAFFPRIHDPHIDNRLGNETRRPRFERYYRNHLRKLLRVERATRYVAKANYHTARLPYLLRLFPDAKFIIPVRSPVGHIASLVRQHEWFSQGQRNSRQALAAMRRAGHFEFGLDRRPMNLGNDAQVGAILQAWSNGKEIEGWARYWDMVYRYLADLLDTDPAVRKAAFVVPFERLCDDPATTLRAVLAHVALPDIAPILEKFVPAIRRPDYYRSPFSVTEESTIRQWTEATARRFGYPVAAT